MAKDVKDKSWAEIGESMGASAVAKPDTETFTIPIASAPALTVPPATSPPPVPTMAPTMPIEEMFTGPVLPPVQAPAAQVIPMPPLPGAQVPPAAVGQSRARGAQPKTVQIGLGTHEWRKPHYFGQGLDQLVPHGTSVNVFKVDDQLHSVYIGNWNFIDLDKYSDAYEFLHALASTKWGFGEFRIAMRLVNGMTSQQFSFHVGHSGMFQGQPQTDPALDVLTDKLRDLEKKADPSMLILINELRSQISDLKRQQAQLPPPVPLPPPEPAVNVAQLVGEIGKLMPRPELSARDLIELTRPVKPGFDFEKIAAAAGVFGPIIEKLMNSIMDPSRRAIEKQAETIERLADTVEDTLEKMKETTNKRPSWREMLDDVRVFQEGAQQMGFRKGGEDGGSFGAHVVEIVKHLPKSIRALGDLAGAINANAKEQAATYAPASPPAAGPAGVAEVPAPPPAFAEFLKAAADATNPGDRCVAIIRAFHTLYSHPYYGQQPDMQQLIADIRGGYTAKVAAGFEEFVNDLSTGQWGQILPPDKAKLVVADVKANIEILVQRLQLELEAEGEEEEEDDGDEADVVDATVVPTPTPAPAQAPQAGDRRKLPREIRRG